MCLVMGAAVAQANPVMIRFDQGYGDAMSMDFEKHGVNVHVTAGDRWVHQNKEGLGVYGGKGDSYDLDGYGYNEVLKLVFSEEVQILRIDFEQVDRSDETAFIVDGEQVAFGYIKKALGMDGAWSDCRIRNDRDECQMSLDVKDKNVWGTEFAFGNGLTDWLDKNDDFRIEAIKFKKKDKPGTQIPEPSAALLFGAGALVTGARVRRRRS